MGIDPGDGAATLADGGHRYGRDVNGELADHLTYAVLRLARAHHGQIGGGAADVKAEGIFHLRHTRHPAGANDTRGRSR